MENAPDDRGKEDKTTNTTNDDGSEQDQVLYLSWLVAGGGELLGDRRYDEDCRERCLRRRCRKSRKMAMRKSIDEE